MDTLMSIKVFRQIVESGSLVAAATRLDFSSATIGKHLVHTERRLGVRLLNRNARTLSLTGPGKVYYERCKAILDELESTERDLGALGKVPRGTLRVTSPSLAAGQRFTDVLAQYRRYHPQVLVDASFEDRMVDLVAEGYDLALRVTPNLHTLPANVIARPLRSSTFYLAASREYLRRHGAPSSPEELSQHDFVAVGSLNSLSFMRARGTIEVPLRVVLRYRSLAGVANAIAAGIGIASVPAVLFEDPTFKAVLTPILPQWPVREATLYVVYGSRRFVPAKIRTFVDFLVQAYSATPEPRLDRMKETNMSPETNAVVSIGGAGHAARSVP